MAIEIWFRHVDRRVPFLWDRREQPAARWHDARRGPVQYASDTPEGAWAEFLRHEGITEEEDLAGVSRSLWALDVELAAEKLASPSLSKAVLTGGLESYPGCRAEAERLREGGATGLVVPAAALLPGTASGEIVSDGELRVAEDRRDGRTLCLFGLRPTLTGHRCADGTHPPERVLALVRHLS